MESSPSFTLGLINNIDDCSMDGTSPMTDLARNLSTLNTNLPQSPYPLISWDSPLPSSCRLLTADDSPFGVDSPTFQEGVLRDLEPNSRQRKYDKAKGHMHRKLTNKKLYAEDKENHRDSPVKSSNAIFKRKLNSENSESDFSGSSQESGYCEAEFAKQTSFPLSPDRIPSAKSSIFTDEEVDDEEGFFSMDKFEDENMSMSMTQLLTNPLRTSVNDCFKPICQSTAGITRKVKPGMRRSFSVVTNFSTPSRSIDTVAMELTSGSPEAEYSSPEKVSFKRPEPINGLTPFQIKRRKSSPNVNLFLPDKPILQRCYSETATTIMNAVQKSEQNPDFIGDFTRPFSLPLIDGRHQDLKTIRCETLMRLINGGFVNVKDFKVIDCRYPYEYEGGHIMGATNVFTEDDLYNMLLAGAKLPEDKQQCLTIFHCEFSSERAPKLYRFLRNKDRELNEDSYPRLYHPEIYLLEGGYKAFFEKYKELCEPRTYKPMLHKDHNRELREFRAKSKSIGNDIRKRPGGNDIRKRPEKDTRTHSGLRPNLKLFS